MAVCSTEYVYHTLLNPDLGHLESILRLGLRPLSDFPDSERWQQIETHMPGFFKKLYHDIAASVVQKPYTNSGVFVSPIDFQQLSTSLMYNKTRVRIPISRIDPDYACLTYVLADQRVSVPLNAHTLNEAARIWTAEMVTEWFARDRTKMFFYVPQIMTYQSGGIPIEPDDIEQFV